MTESTAMVAHQVASHPFVRGMPERDVATLQEVASAVEYATGDVIFEVGGPADRFFLIRTGVVALQLPDRTGVPRTIQTIAEGSALGWSWLLDPHRWRFTASASTPVRALVFDGERLRAWFEDHPDAGYRFLTRLAAVIAERLEATRRQLLHVTGG